MRTSLVSDGFTLGQQFNAGPHNPESDKGHTAKKNRLQATGVDSGGKEGDILITSNQIKNFSLFLSLIMNHGKPKKIFRSKKTAVLFLITTHKLMRCITFVKRLVVFGDHTRTGYFQNASQFVPTRE
jgi:hypothetical protein